MSAASFLGICGMIAFYGYDGFMYSVGWLVAYLTVLLLVAAPLRVRGERIGVIGTASSSPVEYKASDLKALTAIAALAAPTLAQAAAHEASLRSR